MANARDRDLLFDAWLALTEPDNDFAEPVRLPMLSGSMAPALPVGSQLVIASARRAPFGVGSVVVFLRDEQLTAHRLLLVLGFGRGALYLEKGDLNDHAGWIRRREIRGVVTGFADPDSPDGATTPVGRSRPAAWRSTARGLKALLRRVLRPEPDGGRDG